MTKPTRGRRRLVVPGLLLLLAASCAKKPPAPSAGFDPKRDPAADLRAAVGQARREGKRILLDVGGEWCGWCKLLDATLAREDSLRELLSKNYVVVKVNYSDENRNEAFLSRFPKIIGYPHLYVLDPDGNLLHSQNTNVLEAGKGYSVGALEGFFRAWAPARGSGA